MIRVFHPFLLWEDYRHNFYGGVAAYPTKDVVELCANILRDTIKLDKTLAIIIKQWKYSCEHNLSNESMNRIAYLGQSACALLLNVPGSVSMGAYSTLTKEEQKLADQVAQTYLDKWILLYKEKLKNVEFKKISTDKRNGSEPRKNRSDIR